MQSKIKNSVVGVLLAVLIAGLPVLMNVGVLFAKWEMMEKLESQLSTKICDQLVLDAAVYHNIKKGDEIEFSNQRFDVVKAEKKGKYWFIVAVNDSKENALSHLISLDLGNGKNKQSSSHAPNQDWVSGFTFLFNCQPESIDLPMAESNSSVLTIYHLVAYQPPELS